VILILIVALASSAVIAAQERVPNADAVLAAAREALGGESRLRAVKTFIASGRTRQVRGDNLVPIEFEMQCELPDKYVRRDEFPAQDAGPATTGFNGDVLIQNALTAPVPGAGGPPPPPAAQLESGRNARLTTLKEEFARLMLGLFAQSFSSFPLTFTYVGTAEAPQGEADVLDAKGPANFTARFFVHKTTHLPIMVSWRGGPLGPGRGGPPRGGPPPAPPQAAPQRGGANAQQGVETRLYFADYRDVDGVKWPFRTRRAVGPDTIEETIFDRFRINARIDPKKFEVK
jgi:hypothetical protein